jgi:hypothetical protein
MVMTTAQLFLGAVSLGIGLFRGIESHLTFHVETLGGHANHAASVLGAQHARAANAIANNNTVASAIMGPRVSLEAGSITMKESAMIACPQKKNGYMQFVCAQFKRNNPRMQTKLTWARTQQDFLWRTLNALSGDLDRVASLRAEESFQPAIRAADSEVRIRVEDPSRRTTIWGGDSTRQACNMSRDDALDSPMPESPFPLLMPNLLGGLPMALTRKLPTALCGASGLQGPIKLPEVPSVQKGADEDCDDLERRARCEAARARAQSGRQFGGYGTDGYIDECGGSWGGGSRFSRGYRDRDSYGAYGDDTMVVDETGAAEEPKFSEDVRPFMQCEVITPKFGRVVPMRDAISYVQRGKLSEPPRVVTCTFDRNKCFDKRVEKRSEDYLSELSLPSVPSVSRGSSSTRAPSDPNWNHSDLFRACVFASKPVNDKVVQLSDAIRTIESFGAAAPATTLRERYEYVSCAKWYFPDGSGQFQNQPQSEQPFVAAWKMALTAPRGGGRR